MRFLFTAHTLPSHVRAMLPLARAAQQAGHEAAIATGPELTQEVALHGFRPMTAGYNWRPDMDRDNTELGGELGERLADDETRYELGLRYFTGEPAGRMASDLLDAVRSWRPDVIVRSQMEFGGYLAAEKAGIPHASLAISGGPASLFQPERLAPLLAPHREALGMPPDPTGTTVYRRLHAVLMPADYDQAATSLPRTRCYQHTSPQRAGEALPAWLAGRPADLPLVLVGFGTLAPLLTGDDRQRLIGLMRSILAALADLTCTAVVATGDGVPHDLFGPQPHHIHLETHVPQPLLLQRAALFVTHAGFNSVRESLEHGVPMVTVPLFAEQPHNAMQCEHAGVARSVRLPEATPNVLLEAFRQVLDDPSYQRRADALRDRMAALPPLKVLVEDLVDCRSTDAPRTASGGS